MQRVPPTLTQRGVEVEVTGSNYYARGCCGCLAVCRGGRVRDAWARGHAIVAMVGVVSGKSGCSRIMV